MVFGVFEVFDVFGFFEDFEVFEVVEVSRSKVILFVSCFVSLGGPWRSFESLLGMLRHHNLMHKPRRRFMHQICLLLWLTRGSLEVF